MSLEQLDFRFVTQNRGSYDQFLCRYELAATAACNTGGAAYHNFCQDLPRYGRDERNLRAAAEHLHWYGGTAPGRDGIRLADYPKMGLWSVVRELRAHLAQGGYERGPLRRCRVPKRYGSHEKRTIWLTNVRDRFVAGGAKQILTPLLAPIADPLSFCRPRRGGQLALAYVQRRLVDEGHTRWLIEDARNAYDRVVRTRLLQILRHHVPSDDFCELVMHLATAPARHGVLQGSSLSMLLLDVYLTRLLHRPWRDANMPPLVRYVDDCLVALLPNDDAAAVYERLTHYFRCAGMQPKHGYDKALVDLRHQTAQWLGYRVRWLRGQLEIRSRFFDPCTAERSRETHNFLVGKFAQLHQRAEGWRFANSVARGLIARLAPTLPFTDPKAVYEQIAHAAKQAGYEEIWPYPQVLRRWESDHAGWLKMCERIDDVYPLAFNDRESMAPAETPHVDLGMCMA